MTLLIDDMRDIKADIVCRTFSEGLHALRGEALNAPGGSRIDVLYLDHDLGDPDPSRTGYDILCWLEEHPEYLPKKIVLVTANPVGLEKMRNLIERLYGKE